MDTSVEESVDLEELRLALVMNGGVSLCVWMGGATLEVDALRRGEGVYGQVLDLVKTEAIVDVIAGASAGGVNGALLATAIARRGGVEHLRKLWIEKGAFADMMRDPFDRDIPSLLKGDDYFLDELYHALQAGEDTAPSRRPDAGQVHLDLTTSVLQGIETGLADDFGAVIPDVSHRGRFTFRRNDHQDDWARHPADTNGEDRVLRRLALAARSSASFPFAFEPSFCPVGETGTGTGRLRRGGAEHRWPDMHGHTSFTESSYVVDGGALANKPFRPALDAIYQQPAGGQVRRVLLYVCPDPGGRQPCVPEKQEDRPTLLQTVLDSLVTMPREESVAEELADIRRHNDRVAALRQTRKRLLTTRLMDSAEPLDELAAGLWPDYVAGRVESSVERILHHLDAGVAGMCRRGAPELGAGAARGVWARRTVRDALRQERKAALPPEFPERGTPNSGRWRWGVEPIEHVSMTVLDLLRQGLALAPFDESGRRDSLCEARTRLHDVRRRLALLRHDDERFWTDRAPGAFTAAGGDDAVAATRAWAVNAFAAWEAECRPEATGPTTGSAAPCDTAESLALELARILFDRRSVLLAVADLSPKTARQQGEDLSRAVHTLTGGVEDGDGEVEVLRRLLALQVALSVFTPNLPDCDQFVELMLLSGDAGNAFDRSRFAVKDKLAGVQLGHFGGFYKASYRANDWMFGRLDAAERLIQAALSPLRLRQLELSPATVADRVKDMARDGAGDWLEGTAGAFDRQAALDELAFLDPEANLPVPPVLPECVRALTRRVQLGILREEARWLWLAMRLDDQRGAFEGNGLFRVTWESLYGEGRPGDDLPAPEEAVRLFQAWNVAGETIAADAGSRLFIGTIAQAVGVTVAAASAPTAGRLPFRAALKPLRPFVALLVVLARNLAQGGSTGMALVGLSTAVGALLVAIGMADPAPPAWVTGTGAGLLLVGGVLAWLRTGSGPAGFAILALTAAGFIAPLVLIPDHPGSWTRVVRLMLAVAALAVCPWIVDALRGRWSHIRRRQRIMHQRAHPGAEDPILPSEPPAPRAPRPAPTPAATEPDTPHRSPVPAPG